MTYSALCEVSVLLAPVSKIWTMLLWEALSASAGLQHGERAGDAGRSRGIMRLAERRLLARKEQALACAGTTEDVSKQQASESSRARRLPAWIR